MARSLNRNPLNIAVCFVLWSFRGGVDAPAVDLGWGRLPAKWPRGWLKQFPSSFSAVAGRRS